VCERKTERERERGEMVPVEGSAGQDALFEVRDAPGEREIYIYEERERARNSESEKASERERERARER